MCIKAMKWLGDTALNENIKGRIQAIEIKA